MVVDINTYSINKAFIQEWFLKNRNGESIGTIISLLACSTMCPCIVVAYWIGEVSNWHPDALLSIERLTEFYGYTEILNKPPGAPV